MSTKELPRAVESVVVPVRVVASNLISVPSVTDADVVRAGGMLSVTPVPGFSRSSVQTRRSPGAQLVVNWSPMQVTVAPLVCAVLKASVSIGRRTSTSTGSIGSVPELVTVTRTCSVSPRRTGSGFTSTLSSTDGGGVGVAVGVAVLVGVPLGVCGAVLVGVPACVVAVAVALLVDVAVAVGVISPQPITAWTPGSSLATLSARSTAASRPRFANAVPLLAIETASLMARTSVGPQFSRPVSSISRTAASEAGSISTSVSGARVTPRGLAAEVLPGPRSMTRYSFPFSTSAVKMMVARVTWQTSSGRAKVPSLPSVPWRIIAPSPDSRQVAGSSQRATRTTVPSAHGTRPLAPGRRQRPLDSRIAVPRAARTLWTSSEMPTTPSESVSQAVHRERSAVLSAMLTQRTNSSIVTLRLLLQSPAHSCARAGVWAANHSRTPASAARRTRVETERAAG